MDTTPKIVFAAVAATLLAFGIFMWMQDPPPDGNNRADVRATVTHAIQRGEAEEDSENDIETDDE